MPFHQEQLDFITNLANHRLPFLNFIFSRVHYLDTVYFFFAFILLMWFAFSYRWGIRMYYLLTISNLINVLMKGLVGWPRPSTDIPDLGMISLGPLGFPSGGAQTSLLLGALLIYYFRTPTAWILGIFYALLISFSRMYLGVHYPIDILGGWTLGIILFLLFIFTIEPLEAFFKRKGLFVSLILSVAIPAAIILALYDKPLIYPAMGMPIAAGLGIYLSLKYDLFLPDSRTLHEGFGNLFIAIALVSLFEALWPWPDSFAKSFFMGIIVSLLASPVSKKSMNFSLRDSL
jgi:membrane-associated phospholipid phosphatase